MPYLVISRAHADKYGWLEFLNFNARVVDFIDTTY